MTENIFNTPVSDLLLRITDARARGYYEVECLCLRELMSRLDYDLRAAMLWTFNGGPGKSAHYDLAHSVEEAIRLLEKR